MKSLDKFITGIDWKLLQEQKEKVTELISERRDVTQDQELGTIALNGILDAIEQLMAAVIEDGLVEEHHVFPNLKEFKGLEEDWSILDTSNENSLVAEAPAPIEPVCDSTVQVRNAIDLVPGKKYKCLCLAEEDAFQDNFKDGLLKNLTFIKEDNLLRFTSDASGYLGFLIGAAFEEIKEEPAEVNILGKIDTPMHDFYFTFGQGHFTVDGEKMSDSWVRVTGPDEMSARSYFAQFFATPVMGKGDRWAFSYTEDKFDKSHFPAGEYEHFIMLPGDTLVAEGSSGI